MSRWQYGIVSEDGTTYRVGGWVDGRWEPGTTADAVRELTLLREHEPRAYLTTIGEHMDERHPERETHTGVIGVVRLHPVPEGQTPSSIVMARPEVARALIGLADLPDAATLRARYGLVLTEEAPSDGLWMIPEQNRDMVEPGSFPDGWEPVGYTSEDG